MYKNVDFANLNSVDASTLELKYEGGTNPAPALEYALQKSIKRYETCVANGTPTYNPLIFFFTGDSYSTEKVCSDQLKGVVDKYWFYDTLLTFVSCGDEINVEVLDYHSVSIHKLISVNKNDVAKLTGIISKVLWFYQSQSSFEHTDEKYLASFFSKYKF
jgi:uncharacterized protein YegL